jgi:hypothetical protein
VEKRVNHIGCTRSWSNANFGWMKSRSANSEIATRSCRAALLLGLLLLRR